MCSSDLLSLSLFLSPLSLGPPVRPSEGRKGGGREDWGWEGRVGRVGREGSLREGREAGAVCPCSPCPGRRTWPERCWHRDIVPHRPACTTFVGTRARVTPHCMAVSAWCVRARASVCCHPMIGGVKHLHRCMMELGTTIKIQRPCDRPVLHDLSPTFAPMNVPSKFSCVIPTGPSIPNNCCMRS